LVEVPVDVIVGVALVGVGGAELRGRIGSNDD
jgi:hypothetical protein